MKDLGHIHVVLPVDPSISINLTIYGGGYIEVFRTIQIDTVG